MHWLFITISTMIKGSPSGVVICWDYLHPNLGHKLISSEISQLSDIVMNSFPVILSIPKSQIKFIAGRQSVIYWKSQFHKLLFYYSTQTWYFQKFYTAERFARPPTHTHPSTHIHIHLNLMCVMFCCQRPLSRMILLLDFGRRIFKLHIPPWTEWQQYKKNPLTKINKEWM